MSQRSERTHGHRSPAVPERLGGRSLPQLVRHAWRRWYRPPVKHWARIVMNREIHTFVTSLPCERLAAAEISGDTHGGHGWKTYERLTYPGFDLCDAPPPARTYDVVICEQVLEHVRDPWLAVRALHDLCAPGGHVIVSTPFLIKVHPSPDDFWRFTPRGLTVLLEGAGFTVDTVAGWGNRDAVIGNLRDWAPRRRWHSLRNEPQVPLVVWAFASKDADHAPSPVSTG